MPCARRSLRWQAIASTSTARVTPLSCPQHNAPASRLRSVRLRRHACLKAFVLGAVHAAMLEGRTRSHVGIVGIVWWPPHHNSGRVNVHSGLCYAITEPHERMRACVLHAWGAAHAKVGYFGPELAPFGDLVVFEHDELFLSKPLNSSIYMFHDSADAQQRYNACNASGGTYLQRVSPHGLPKRAANDGLEADPNAIVLKVPTMPVNVVATTLFLFDTTHCEVGVKIRIHALHRDLNVPRTSGAACRFHKHGENCKKSLCAGDLNRDHHKHLCIRPTSQLQRRATFLRYPGYTKQIVSTCCVRGARTMPIRLISHPSL